jgi:hypothetical protein
MAETSAPWAAPVGDATNGTPWSEALHRELWGASLGDGILGDVTGASYQASINGTNKIRIQPGRASVRGHRHILDALADLTVSSVSGVGNTRLDYAVLRHVPSATTPASKIVLQAVEGVGAASPVLPALTRAEGSGWMFPLCSWRRTPTGIDTLVDLRQWAGPSLLVASSAALPSDAPLGTTAVVLSTGARWWRDIVAGAPTWVTDTASATAYVTSEQTPGSGSRSTKLPLTSSREVGGMRVLGGQIVVPFTGRYRIDAQLRGFVPATSASGYQITSQVKAGGTVVASADDYVPDTGVTRAVTVSLLRPDVALSAGTALEWWVTTGGAGALSLSAGEVSSSITVTKVG